MSGTSGERGEENPVECLVHNGLADPVSDANEDSIQGPTASVAAVLHCQLSSWYSTFSNCSNQKRKNVTIQSIVLDSVPPDFISWLLSDGVQLPVGASKLSSCANVGKDDSSSDGEPENEERSDCSESKQFHFPELNEQIAAAIESLGGVVIPKLNWSSPKDATWVNSGSLKCETPGDIYLLIKSSDFCLHDVLRNALKDCEDYEETISPPKLQLVLRKWCNLYPNMEFRCFVRQNELGMFKFYIFNFADLTACRLTMALTISCGRLWFYLVAISQRNHTQQYPHLIEDMPRIRDEILNFFEDVVRNRFANGTLPHYVFDVYIDKKRRVWVIDFNIWARSTDSLLFEWSELLTLDVEDDPYFRVVETQNQVRQDPLASYRAPIDTVNLAGMVGGDATRFEEFMKQCQMRSQDETDSEDDS